MNTEIIIVISVLFSAFFSGVEIAFISANKLQIELKKKQGLLSGKVLSWLKDRSSIFLGAMLIGNNIALVVYGTMMAELINPLLENYLLSWILVLLVQTIISTTIILFAAEFLPKSIFRNNPNGTLSFLYFPIAFMYGLLWLPALIITGLASLFLRIIGGTKNNTIDDNTFGRVDLDNYLKEATRNTDQREMEHEVQIFQNALEFGDIKARECMVPRTDIVAVDLEEEIEVLKQKFVELEHSKILIYRENIDNIIGYVHHFELFKKPKSIKNALLPVFVVPEAMPANEVLKLFIQKQKSIAIVVDELGGTSGMVTLEDVVEEIFGEIEDEHDIEDQIDLQIDDNDFRFSARMEIDYLNEAYKLKLPDIEGVETLGGLILYLEEDIPDEGTKVVYDQFLFTIEKVNENRIDLIHIHVNS